MHFEAMDDAADLFFLPLKDIRTEEFGLGSIRKEWVSSWKTYGRTKVNDYSFLLWYIS